jgi:uncharacterized membrane protein
MSHRSGTSRRSRGRRPSGARPRSPAALTAVVVALGAIALIGMVALWPGGDVRGDLRGLGVAIAAESYEARVTDVREVPCQGTQPEEDILCLRATFAIVEGPDRGRSVTQEFPVSANVPRFDEGESVIVAHDPQAAEEFQYRFADRDRESVLAWLALGFAVAVVALGRLRGMAALIGLAATFAVLLRFVLPAILEGESPLLVAVVGAAVIAFMALYLAHGFTPMTSVALVGTLASLALTAILASVFVDAARITGLATEEALIIRVGAAQIDLAGLMLGGVVIGALGAIDDMTVTQASAVWELRAANPAMNPGALARAGMRIGRDHVASTVNTLFLAYAGASMPLLVLFVLSRQSLITVANTEIVATEIVRTLVGSIGLVASVPLTTWLAAYIAPRSISES